MDNTVYTIVDDLIFQVKSTPRFKNKAIREDVLRFIYTFKYHSLEKCDDSEAVMHHQFAAGYCYHFALILKEMFGGEICWHKGYSHVVWRDTLTYIAYDIDGIFENYDEENPLVSFAALTPEERESFYHRFPEYKGWINPSETKEISVYAYKALDSQMTDEYGFQFKLGEKYQVNANCADADSSGVSKSHKIMQHNRFFDAFESPMFIPLTPVHGLPFLSIGRRKHGLYDRLFKVKLTGNVKHKSNDSFHFLAPEITIIEEVTDWEKCIVDDLLKYKSMLTPKQRHAIFSNVILSEDIIDKFDPSSNDRLLTIKYQVLSEKYIAETMQFIDASRSRVINEIMINQTVSEDFIKKHIRYISWISTLTHQKVSEEFIEKNSGDFYTYIWHIISKYQTLSEEFMDKYSDKLDWECLTQHQQMSETFMTTHADKIAWDMVPRFQKVSPLFIENHKFKIYGQR